MLGRNRQIDLIVFALAGLSMAGWFGGFSLFGFRSPFWDVGLLPLLVSMIVGLFHLKGPLRLFLRGFEACGAIAILLYIFACSGPARWSYVSALLPFQSGFWLDPEMAKSGVALVPWKILIDALVLACIPLVPALIAGWLASTKYSLRRVMAMVAAVAVVLGLGSAYLRRVRHYDEMGQYHHRQVVGVLSVELDGNGGARYTPTGSDPAGRPLPDAQRRLDAWHEAMARRYWEAARYPWITVEEPPPIH